MRVLALLLAVLAVSSAERKRYDGYQLLSVFPRDEAQRNYVTDLQVDVELDFWYEGPDRLDILVPPHKIQSFLSGMMLHHIRHEVVHSDIQQDIDEELRSMAESKETKPAGMIIDYDQFNTLDDIFLELDDLVRRCPPGFTCATFEIGQSVENKPLRGLSIRQGTNRPSIWLDATIHAREWLSTATLLKIVRHFVYDYTDPTVNDFLNTYDFWFLPVVNPDGYTYTHTNERLWRKSRNRNTGSNCIGTDLNRNFDQMWSNAGSSNNPCSETFHGASAGSEPETRALQDALTARASNLVFTIHFHTYGYLWLIPWGSVTSGSNCRYAADDAEMMVVANAAANAVQNTYGTNTWARGNSCATIYPASGITMDYTKGVAGVKYTYTPELRGNNFIIAADQIDPSYREVWNGVVATVNAIEAAKMKN